jgi:hypothetical protein
MRYVVSKALRKRFTQRLGRALPHFRERKARSGVRGTFLYEWRATAALTCYVALVVDDERDAFTVEVAWSRMQHFPAGIRNHAPGEPARAGAMRLQLRALWQPYRLEPWWSLVPRSPREIEADSLLADPAVPVERKVAIVEEHERLSRTIHLEPTADEPPPTPDTTPVTEALTRIAPAVDDAIARLVQHAVPFFERAVVEHGGGPAFERRAVSFGA